MLLEVGARGQAAHAVGDEDEPAAGATAKKVLDVPVQLRGERVDAREGRLKAHRPGAETVPAQLPQHPPPKAAIAGIAMHEQHRQRVSQERALPGGAHEQPVEGLDEGEERKVGGAFSGDYGASREEAKRLIPSALARPRPSNGEGDENQGCVECEQNGDGEQGGVCDARPEEVSGYKNANKFNR